VKRNDLKIAVDVISVRLNFSVWIGEKNGNFYLVRGDQVIACPSKEVAKKLFVREVITCLGEWR
jgi:hypothetical protein